MVNYMRWRRSSFRFLKIIESTISICQEISYFSVTDAIRGQMFSSSDNFPIYEICTYNYFISSGNFPKFWKSGYFIPILKGGFIKDLRAIAALVLGIKLFLKFFWIYGAWEANAFNKKFDCTWTVGFSRRDEPRLELSAHVFGIMWNYFRILVFKIVKFFGNICKWKWKWN